MSQRIISVSELLGRSVRDVDGKRLGRIEELNAEIVLHEWGNDYSVTSVSVGRYGPLDMLASGRFVQQFVQRMRGLIEYGRFEIPWNWLDLSDPAHPRLLRRVADVTLVGR